MGSDSLVLGQAELLCACSRTGSDGGDSSAARAAWCLYSHTGSEGGGGLECSAGCSVPEVIQGVRERVQNPPRE